MINQLKKYRDTGVISDGDIAAARLLVDITVRNGGLPPEILGWLLLCLTLRTQRDSHTCVDLSRIIDWRADIDLDLPSHLDWSVAPSDWLAAATASPTIFGDPDSTAPLIVDDQRVYLARSYAEESAIATALTRNNADHLSIILGGPGTGKTTTVAKRLIERLSKGGEHLNIALVAPTGKAAARMRDVLLARCRETGASESVMQEVNAAHSSTVHSLLGFAPSGTTRYKFNPQNQLPFDWVVVDEASMMSASLMYRLLEALRPNTELLLVGDASQLASVDAGSVLADVASVAMRDGSVLHSRTTEMIVQRRFPSGSDIEKFAAAVRIGDATNAMEVLDGELEYILWIDPTTKVGKKQLQDLEQETVAHAAKIVDDARKGDITAALKLRLEFQVLCAHRSGQYGVSHWNDLVERKLGPSTDNLWYVGRPVMVTRNNHSLKLYNGDIGIAIEDQDGHPEVAFGDEHEIRLLSTTRLEDVQTVHALTIHKSQGSEFGHAVVILPNETSRILTRELLYTGVTRVRKKLTIVGSRKVIESAISRSIRRATGLADRL